MEEKEKILEGILEDMKEATEGGKKNGVKVVGKTWRELRVMKRGVGNEARGVVGKGAVENGDAKGVEPLTAKDEVKVGDLLVVVANSPFRGKTGTVVKDGGKMIELGFGGMTSRFKRGDLGRSGGVETGGGTSLNKGKKKGISKRVEEDLRSHEMDRVSGRKKGDGRMMRMDSNTIDVRGNDMDDALLMIRDFFASNIRAGKGTVYVLHGHGTGGVLKKKVREALRLETIVKRYKAADDEDGGDSFTEVQLKDGIM